MGLNGWQFPSFIFLIFSSNKTNKHHCLYISIVPFFGWLLIHLTLHLQSFILFGNKNIFFSVLIRLVITMGHKLTNFNFLLIYVLIVTPSLKSRLLISLYFDNISFTIIKIFLFWFWQICLMVILLFLAHVVNDFY